MSETVIREVTKNIWTFSKPFLFGTVPLGGRSTAIKLEKGGVWVLASTALNTETRTKIDELGPVKFIVSPNSGHHLFLTEFQQAYPEAKVFATAGALEKHPNKELKAAGVWGKDPSGTQYGFEDEIQHCYFPAFPAKDVVFLHTPSKTLLEADLLFNLPATEQYSKVQDQGETPLVGNELCSSWLQSILSSLAGQDKEEMTRDAQTVNGWDFDRIVPCHGDVLETGGKKAWADGFKIFLE
ncbi:hypothetical protein CYLTODRAFT_417504 [Cylindrobasidium torrendii FP15055 ss-10]|uniref:Metallo-hydrolase/oxidoreductase n=1 Tax=Cylindrobasidium torrendii FP15055 ss-10 TaxID=1314674 RepID=A0A0D7BR24_9AGAR|nr:hypothetical protein CYLTODRAFT_417504 [Cylindrobasidium torrendii FP15055 ss-10]